MSVNGVTGASDVYSAYTTQSKSTETKTENTASDKKTTESAGAVYEPSKEDKVTASKKTYKPDTNMVDIAEDGYWGVSQTSQRILDFATALTGGDPDKIEEMRAAFQKGFKQAEKTWGGQLPDISQRTYDAVMKGFDDMAAASKTEE